VVGLIVEYQKIKASTLLWQRIFFESYFGFKTTKSLVLRSLYSKREIDIFKTMTLKNSLRNSLLKLFESNFKNLYNSFKVMKTKMNIFQKPNNFFDPQRADPMIV